MVDSGLHKSRNELFSEWNDIYSGRAGSDVLIMGSSRAWVQYSPAIIGDRLNMSAYNIGIDGWTFPMQEKRFEIYLKHNPKPKIIIQNLDPFMLTDRADLYTSEQFLPYLDDPDIRRATSNYKGSFGWAQVYLPLLKYNNRPDLVVLGLSNYFGLDDSVSTKDRGYQGQDQVWDSSFEKFRQANPDGVTYSIDPNVETTFRGYLKYCATNGIKIYLVYSPEYIEMQPLFRNREEIIERYQQLAKENGAIFIDYSDSPISADRRNFYNSQHLSRIGAEAFSRDLAERIR